MLMIFSLVVNNNGTLLKSRQKYRCYPKYHKQEKRKDQGYSLLLEENVRKITLLKKVKTVMKRIEGDATYLPKVI